MSDRIGRYLVDDVWREEPLGRIVRARLPEFERAVLIRELVPPPHLPLEDRQRLTEAFLEECRLLGRVRHTHVQAAHDIGTTESGAPFLVYERPDPAAYHSLAEIGRSLSVEAAVSLTGELARTLAFLQSAGVACAVFTPADVFLTRTGQIRVLPLSFTSLAVRFGAALAGGVPYLAPELLHGAAASERAAVYSLGAWLYRILAPAAPPPEEAAAEGREPDPLWTQNPSVRAAVDEALQAALARDPSRRLATLTELAARLQAPASSVPVPAPAAPAPPAPRREEAAPVEEEEEIHPVVRYVGWGAGLAVAGGFTGWVLAQLFPPR